MFVIYIADSKGTEGRGKRMDGKYGSNTRGKCSFGKPTRHGNTEMLSMK